MTLAALRRRVESLNIEQVARESINETKEVIADLNAEQMFRGLRADGSEITPSYSELTVQIKKMKGQVFDHVTLRDTGAFQQAMFVRVSGLQVITGSSDLKSPKLERKYSKAKGSIFGLSEKFRAEYLRESLRPTFQQRITNLTGLKFG